jgi:hypothetical protein
MTSYLYQIDTIGVDFTWSRRARVKEKILVTRESLTSSVAMEECALFCFPINLSDFLKFLSNYITCFCNTSANSRLEIS